MADCVFCDIVAGEAPAHRLCESERTLAFLDAAPANPGHALVVPKAHRETLTDLEPALAGDLFRTVRRVANAVESAFEPDGLNVVQSNGAAAGQEVFHAHVHVVPRHEDDDVTVEWSGGERTGESDSEVATALRDAL